MKVAASLLISVLLAACASAPPMPPPDGLFHDELFDAPSAPIDPGEAMAVSAGMRSFIATRIVTGSPLNNPKRRLFDALYRKDALMLDYDAAVTRTAAQAFEARSGNCLALVLMTAAFAKEMGLAVRYQSVLGHDAWDRAADVYLSVGHVNLTLVDRASQASAGFTEGESMTIDFMPPHSSRPLRTRVIAEHTVIAMYLNNRAVESLTGGRLGDAYGWAREAIRADPELLSAYITLGVVYRNQHHPELADQALRRVIEREPDNTKALSNRVLVLRDLGRHAEADALLLRLDRLEPHPPFSYFHQGMAALREHRLEAARDLFEKEVNRAPNHHEFQFWLAIAYLELQDPARAVDHLTQAMEVSNTRKDHDLYAAKLERLKSHGSR